VGLGKATVAIDDVSGRRELATIGFAQSTAWRSMRFCLVAVMLSQGRHD
jgi:hypothetical protein